jgi:hypothetical protein
LFATITVNAQTDKNQKPKVIATEPSIEEKAKADYYSFN